VKVLDKVGARTSALKALKALKKLKALGPFLETVGTFDGLL
jgi:hypothetical protein